MNHANIFNYYARQQGKSIRDFYVIQYALLCHGKILYFTLNTENVLKRLSKLVPHALVKIVDDNYVEIKACCCMRLNK